MTTISEDQLSKLLAPYGQTHLLRFWNTLNDGQKVNLAEQIVSVDWAKTVEWANKALEKAPLEIPFDELTPAPYVPLEPANDKEAAFQEECRQRGDALLRAGKLAGFTVAGGQGTRLGYDGPKGTFRFTSIRNASLFQVFAESILRYQEKYSCILPWYIMTSPANNQATIEFFQANNYFGLDSANVMFFIQGTLPAFGLDGKAILATPDSLALSANGHGGSFAALKDSGALEDMQKRGISILSYWQVDNPMVKLFDPLFIGMHDLTQSDMSSRALIKRDPMEKLGHFCKLHGSTTIVEYSDMKNELLYQMDETGQLAYRAGSPAIHLLSCDFIRRLTNGTLNLLPHRANKKVPFVDENGVEQQPASPNAIKLEFFLFDALPFAKNPLILAGDRKEQFAPIKNAEGADSPASCREALLERTAKWFALAGKKFPLKADGTPDAVVEIAPRRCVGAEDLVAQFPALDGVSAGDSVLLD